MVCLDDLNQVPYTTVVKTPCSIESGRIDMFIPAFFVVIAMNMPISIAREFKDIDAIVSAYGKQRVCSKKACLLEILPQALKKQIPLVCQSLYRFSYSGIFVCR